MGKATHKTVSGQIRDLIRQAERGGTTRYAIGKATGVSQSTLCRFAAGERKLSQDAIDALAEYFGVELQPKGRR